MLRTTFILLVTLVFASGSPAQETNSRLSTKQVSSSDAAAGIAAYVNAYRKSKGRAALKPSSKLDRAAMKHANDMARKGYFSHRSPDGSLPRARTKSVGYRACLVAENISYRWRTPEQVVNGWIKSPKHRQIMLMRDVTEFGVGYSQGDYWVLVVARPGC